MRVSRKGQKVEIEFVLMVEREVTEKRDYWEDKIQQGVYRQVVEKGFGMFGEGFEESQHFVVVGYAGWYFFVVPETL